MKRSKRVTIHGKLVKVAKALKPEVDDDESLDDVVVVVRSREMVPTRMVRCPETRGGVSLVGNRLL